MDKYRFKHLFAAVAGLLLIQGCAEDSPPPPQITVGQETTFFTSPTRPDGTVGYIDALNERYRTGVTAENNAARLLVQAFPADQMIAHTTRPRTEAALNLQFPEQGDLFVKLEEFPELTQHDLDAVRSGPWKSADHPAVAAWLERNSKPLAMVTEATQRERYYLPLLTAEPDGTVNQVLLPGLNTARWAANALLARANLKLGQGDVAGAWEDIRAVHRLGRLIGQTPLMIPKIVGLSLTEDAAQATQVLAKSPDLNAVQARSILTDLHTLPPLPDVAEGINLGERAVLLDLLTQLARRPREALRALESMPGFPTASDPLADMITPATAFAGVDWDAVLRKANQAIDQRLQAMRQPTGTQRQAALRALETPHFDVEEIRTDTSTATDLDRLRSLQRLPALNTPEERTLAVEAVIDYLEPSPAHTQELADSALTQHRLAILSVALAGYHTVRGQYPETLQALIPDWLASLPDDPVTGQPLRYERQN